jgi:hypothetical protein
MEETAASFNPAVAAFRHPQLSFRFSEVLLGKLIPPNSFTIAFEKAKIILSSDLFRNAFTSEVKDVNIGKLEAFLNQNIQVCALKNKSTVTAYAAVYRELHPTTIFFNPWMLLNIVDKERSLPDNLPIRIQLILFLTAKIVHQVSHPASFMDVDDCTLFKSKDDMVGFYVDGSQTLSKIKTNSVDFSFVLANPFQARKLKSFAFMALEGGF